VGNTGRLVTDGIPRPDDLAIEVDHQHGAPLATVRVAGGVDVATAPDLTVALDRVLVGGATDVRIDLSAVPFMDSTGLTTLIEAGTKLQGRGAVVVTGASDAVRRTLDIAGLGTCFAFPGGGLSGTRPHHVVAPRR